MDFKILFSSLLLLSSAHLEAKDICGLKTEYMDNPIGIDVAYPRFRAHLINRIYEMGS